MERKHNMERFVAPMATWEIVGGDLPPVRVRARTFDEALAKARLRDPGYCAGWVVEQALELFRMMPDNKKSSLHNALSRNLEFTTSWGLELGELRAYQNGVYITLQGTRCSFSVYAELVNGKPVFKRKPPESKLSLKFRSGLLFDAGDFNEF